MGEFHVTLEARGVEISVTDENGYSPTVFDDLASRIPAVLVVAYRELVLADRELGIERHPDLDRQIADVLDEEEDRNGPD